MVSHLTPLIPPLLLLVCWLFTRARSQFLARAGHSHRPGVPMGFSTLRLRTFHDHNVAKFHRVPRPTIPLNDRRGAHLTSPVHDLASLFLDVNVEVDVGILPFDLRHS